MRVIVTSMRLREEANLRMMIRRLISETVKMNHGWDGYKQGDDNFELDPGYHAAYHQQYANAALDLDKLVDTQGGGENVIMRHKKQRGKKPKSK